MIRAVIRTLSDSALFLKNAKESSSGRLSVGTRGDLTGSWTLTQLISSPLGLYEYLSPGKQVNYSKTLPMEVISLIVSFIAASPKGRATLLNLLFVDKRWNACAAMHLWEHVDIENQKTWTAFHPSLFRTSTHFYGSFIRDVLISEVTLELNQWITFMDELVGLQILSLEKIAIRRDTVGGPANRTQPILLCLKNVSLSDCSREIMHAIILLFQRAQRLKRLCITGCDFNEGDLCTIATMCPRLADFTLGVDEEHGSGGDAFASTLALSCPKIQSLDLIGLSLQTGLGSLIKAYGSRLKKLHLKKMSQISAADLMLIAEYCKGSTLNKLTLSRLPLLTDRVLDRILRATGASIEFLQLDSLPITDAGLAAVTRNCTNLTQLRMYDLRELQDLSFLNSKWPRLKQIILHGSPDIAEVESLDNLGAPLLERLELVGCLSVPQDSLRRMLFHFTNLSRFVYVGAHATGDFQKELKKRLPRCNATLYPL